MEKEISKLLMGELIGLKMEVIDSNNKNVIGLKGIVIDETKNTFVFDNGKRVLKENVIVRIRKGDKLFDVNGKLLVGRSEDRIKRIRRL